MNYYLAVYSEVLKVSFLRLSVLRFVYHRTILPPFVELPKGKIQLTLISSFIYLKLHPIRNCMLRTVIMFNQGVPCTFNVEVKVMSEDI